LADVRSTQSPQRCHVALLVFMLLAADNAALMRSHPSVVTPVCWPRHCLQLALQPAGRTVPYCRRCTRCWCHPAAICSWCSGAGRRSCCRCVAAVELPWEWRDKHHDVFVGLDTRAGPACTAWHATGQRLCAGTPKAPPVLPCHQLQALHMIRRMLHQQPLDRLDEYVSIVRLIIQVAYAAVAVSELAVGSALDTLSAVSIPGACGVNEQHIPVCCALQPALSLLVPVSAGVHCWLALTGFNSGSQRSSSCSSSATPWPACRAGAGDDCAVLRADQPPRILEHHCWGLPRPGRVQYCSYKRSFVAQHAVRPAAVSGGAPTAYAWALHIGWRHASCACSSLSDVPFTKCCLFATLQECYNHPADSP